MAKMELRSRYNGRIDKTEVELLQEGQLVGHVDLEASDAESLIWQLASARKEMREHVSDALDPNSRLETAESPSWLVVAGKVRGRPELNTTMALRHPGLGWVAFSMKPEDATALARQLTETAARPQRQK